jgi:hypothetical protein
VSENGNGKAVANLSDELVAKARAIASRSDELLDLLEDARQRLLDSDADGGASKARPPAPKRRFKPKSESKPKPKATAKSSGKPSGELSEGLRLLTSQMAAAGADRREIANRLRDDFAIEDPEPILKSMGL